MCTGTRGMEVQDVLGGTMARKDPPAPTRKTSWMSCSSPAMWSSIWGQSCRACSCEEPRPPEYRPGRGRDMFRQSRYFSCCLAFGYSEIVVRGGLERSVQRRGVVPCRSGMAVMGCPFPKAPSLRQVRAEARRPWSWLQAGFSPPGARPEGSQIKCQPAPRVSAR